MILRKKDKDDITVLLEYYKDNIKLVYVDDYKKRSYPILVSPIVDYKEEVFIIGIKTNM